MSLAGSVSLGRVDEFIEALRYYASRPVEFVEDILKVQLFDWQRRALHGLVAKRRAAIKSGRGAGKTRYLACVILWLLLCVWPVKILITAPTFPQLRQIVFPEVKNVAEQAGLSRLLKWSPTEIHARIGRGIVSSAYARTSRHAEGVHGFHAPVAIVLNGDPIEGTMALLADEASGVDDDFFLSARGSNTGSSNFTVYTGNPTRNYGEFYTIFNRDETLKRWYTDTVDSRDVPIVDNEEYVEDMIARYGEESDAFAVHVRGEFPQGNLNGLVPLGWLEDAKLFSKTNFSRLASRTDGFVVGVDVARKGEDSSVVLVRQGRFILADYLEKFRGMTTDELTVHVYTLYGDLLKLSPTDPNTGKKVKPIVCVDSTGIGAGVFDQLKVKKVNVREVVVAERAPETDPRCHRLRDWLYWQIREFFNPENDLGAVILYSNERKRDLVEQMIAECSRLTYDFTPSDEIRVEPKVKYKSRNQGKSPDSADALALSFFTSARVATKRKPKSLPWRKNLQPVGWVV